MTPTVETRIATFLALTLGALVPVLATSGHGFAAGGCGAVATGIVGAYHIARPGDRASTGKTVPPPAP